MGCGDAPADRQILGGDPARGARLVADSGCGGCHTIPGIRGANGLVGPPLDRFGRRGFIAGRMANQPDNLLAWLRDPRAVDPQTAMPAPGLDEADLRDVAAFLYQLR